MTQKNHYLCTRCGVILVKYPTKPDFCPKCGGVNIEDIGEEGTYNFKQLRKDFKIPFRPDHFFENPG